MSSYSTPRRSARLNPGAEGQTPPSDSCKARGAPGGLRGLEQQVTAQQILQWLFVTWLLVLLVGVLMHKESAAHGSKEEVQRLKRALPLSPYDWAFRKLGAILWLPAFMLRGLGMQLAGYGNQKAHHFRAVFAVYLLIVGSRGLLYACHYYGSMVINFTTKPEDYFSDHVLLGASLASILSAEITLCLRSVKFISPGSPLLAQRTGYVIAAALYLLTTGDMYFTAVYFHPRFEVFVAILLGMGYQAFVASLLLLPKSLPAPLQPLTMAFNDT